MNLFSENVEKPLSMTHSQCALDLWLPFQPKVVLVAPTQRGMARLSWPRWLITYRDSLPAKDGH